MVMNEIKKYEKLVEIRLKDGSLLTTTASLESVSDMLNKNDFCVIWGMWFSKFEVKSFKEYVPTDIDSFILSQDVEIQDRLRKILEERREKWFKTNWTEHLWNIYLSKYWE